MFYIIVVVLCGATVVPCGVIALCTNEIIIEVLAEILGLDD